MVFVFCFFCLLGPHPRHYGSSQARAPVRAIAAGLHQSHSNAGSLIHWASPGTEPTFSWMLVGFVNCWATMGTPISGILTQSTERASPGPQRGLGIQTLSMGCWSCRWMHAYVRSPDTQRILSQMSKTPKLRNRSNFYQRVEEWQIWQVVTQLMELVLDDFGNLGWGGNASEA